MRSEITIGPWIGSIAPISRRYWNDDSDLAAITGTSTAGLIGWRVFNPEGEDKWIREGTAITLEQAQKDADQMLRARYGVPVRLVGA